MQKRPLLIALGLLCRICVIFLVMVVVGSHLFGRPTHLVPRKPGKLVFNGGARRSAARGIRRKAPRRSAG